MPENKLFSDTIDKYVREYSQDEKDNYKQIISRLREEQNVDKWVSFILFMRDKARIMGPPNVSKVNLARHIGQRLVPIIISHAKDVKMKKKIVNLIEQKEKEIAGEYKSINAKNEAKFRKENPDKKLLNITPN